MAPPVPRQACLLSLPRLLLPHARRPAPRVILWGPGVFLWPIRRPCSRSTPMCEQTHDSRRPRLREPQRISTEVISKGIELDSHLRVHRWVMESAKSMSIRNVETTLATSQDGIGKHIRNRVTCPRSPTMGQTRFSLRGETFYWVKALMLPISRGALYNTLYCALRLDFSVDQTLLNQKSWRTLEDFDSIVSASRARIWQQCLLYSGE